MDQHERRVAIRREILLFMADESIAELVFTYPAAQRWGGPFPVQVVLERAGRSRTSVTVRSEAVDHEQAAILKDKGFKSRPGSISPLFAANPFEYYYTQVVEGKDVDDLLTIVESIFLTLFGEPVGYMPSIRTDATRIRLGTRTRLIVAAVLAAGGALALLLMWVVFASMI